MKKITLFYNQRTEGGAVNWEKWQASNIEDKSFTYGSGECLKSVDVEIPDEWEVKKDMFEQKQIYDANGYAVELSGKYDGEIYASTSEKRYPIKLKRNVE